MHCGHVYCDTTVNITTRISCNTNDANNFTWLKPMIIYDNKITEYVLGTNIKTFVEVHLHRLFIYCHYTSYLYYQVAVNLEHRSGRTTKCLLNMNVGTLYWIRKCSVRSNNCLPYLTMKMTRLSGVCG